MHVRFENHRCGERRLGGSASRQGDVGRRMLDVERLGDADIRN